MSLHSSIVTQATVKTIPTNLQIIVIVEILYGYHLATKIHSDTKFKLRHARPLDNHGGLTCSYVSGCSACALSTCTLLLGNPNLKARISILQETEGVIR